MPSIYFIKNEEEGWTSAYNTPIYGPLIFSSYKLAYRYCKYNEIDVGLIEDHPYDDNLAEKLEPWVEEEVVKKTY